MPIRYVLDNAGRKLAALPPYDEWEALASLPEHLEPNEETVHAKQAGLLSKVAPVMDRMEVLGFRLSARTRAEALRMAGEE